MYPVRDILQAMPRESMQDVLRKAFADSGLSIKKLSALTGLPYSVTHRVVNGVSDPQLSTVEKISRVVGLELRRVKKREN